jgi:hypothetical protein
MSNNAIVVRLPLQLAFQHSPTPPPRQIQADKRTEILRLKKKGTLCLGVPKAAGVDQC